MLPSIKEIVKQRKILGLTQKRLAKLAGVSQSLIAKLENGQIDPSYTKVKAMFDILVALENKKEISAKEILNDKIVGVQKHATVSASVKLMKDYGYSQLPVFDGRHAIGSLSEKTVLKHILIQKDPDILTNLPVEKIMDEAFPQIGEDAPFPLISSLLQIYSAVLVSKKGKIKGIITKADLLKVLK